MSIVVHRLSFKIQYIAAIAFGKNTEIRISVTIYHISIMIDLLLIFLFGICFMSIDDQCYIEISRSISCLTSWITNIHKTQVN